MSVSDRTVSWTTLCLFLALAVVEFFIVALALVVGGSAVVILHAIKDEVNAKLPQMHKRLDSEQRKVPEARIAFSGQFQSIDSATTTPHVLICRRKQESDCREGHSMGKTTQEATDVCDLMRYSKQRDTCTRGYFFPVLCTMAHAVDWLGRPHMIGSSSTSRTDGPFSFPGF